MRVANILEHRPEGETFVLPKGYSHHKQRLYSLLGADSPNTFKLPGVGPRLNMSSPYVDRKGKDLICATRKVHPSFAISQTARTNAVTLT
jgi:hypothetical protein